MIMVIIPALIVTLQRTRGVTLRPLALPAAHAAPMWSCNTNIKATQRFLEACWDLGAGARFGRHTEGR